MFINDLKEIVDSLTSNDQVLITGNNYEFALTKNFIIDKFVIIFGENSSPKFRLYNLNEMSIDQIVNEIETYIAGYVPLEDCVFNVIE